MQKFISVMLYCIPESALTTLILVASCRAIYYCFTHLSFFQILWGPGKTLLFVWSLIQSLSLKLEQNCFCFFSSEVGVCVFCLLVLVKYMLTISQETILHMVIYINCAVFLCHCRRILVLLLFFTLQECFYFLIWRLLSDRSCTFCKELSSKNVRIILKL